MADVDMVVIEKDEGSLKVEFEENLTVHVDRTLGISILRNEHDPEASEVQQVDYPDALLFLDQMKALAEYITENYGDWHAPVD